MKPSLLKQWLLYQNLFIYSATEYEIYGFNPGFLLGLLSAGKRSAHAGTYDIIIDCSQHVLIYLIIS